MMPTTRVTATRNSVSKTMLLVLLTQTGRVQGCGLQATCPLIATRTHRSMVDIRRGEFSFAFGHVVDSIPMQVQLRGEGWKRGSII
jgi:hypothetical protein